MIRTNTIRNICVGRTTSQGHARRSKDVVCVAETTAAATRAAAGTHIALIDPVVVVIDGDVDEDKRRGSEEK